MSTATIGTTWVNPAAAGPVPAAELAAVVAALGQQALALAAGSPQPPSYVRLTVGEIVVELGWPGGESASVAAAVAAPAAPVAPVVPLAAPAAPPNGAAGAAPAPAPAAPAGDTFTLNATTVGVLYRSSEPGAAPFVAEGDIVRPGQQVAIIEAMKLMIPLEAEKGGRVVEVLVDNGESVEYGQPVLRLEAAS
jgi:acetyl-CoA carboxylase biotin carboxyl carrier protein